MRISTPERDYENMVKDADMLSLTGSRKEHLEEFTATIIRDLRGTSQGNLSPLPHHGLIVIHAPLNGGSRVSLSSAIQEKLFNTLAYESKTEVERFLSTPFEARRDAHDPKPWEYDFIEALDHKSLAQAPKKSVLLCALPRDAQYLPLVVAKAMLAKNKQWLIVQQLAPKKHASRPELFTSSEDKSFVTMCISKHEDNYVHLGGPRDLHEK
jgi:hypothetical protein